VRIDGNDVLAVYDTIRGVRDYCISNNKPYLVECMTFRMRGHEEASGTKYVPKEMLDTWAEKDPIKKYEQWLVQQQVITEMQIADIRHEFKQYIETELSLAGETKELVPDTDDELRDVYAAKSGVRSMESGVKNETELAPDSAPAVRLVDAISNALTQSMEKHSNLILMGQDIAEYGGAFKITEGFVERFGKSRVRNTPLCESAILGAALGLSLEGYKSVMEMQFADFVSVGFNQIVNNLAKIHYRWGQNADVVIRMPTGGGVGAGPFHSQSNEAWFTHVPGLKVVYAATPADAKGLLIAAINDPNPVMFFEHKALYRSISGEVSGEYYETEIGKAKTVSAGEDITIITYGAGVHWALEYQEQHPDISLHILDLRTLLPLDYPAIKEGVAKTGKVLLLHEDSLTGGIGGEISAWIGEHCFELLDAPIMRCGSLDTPIPFNIELEKNYMAKSRLHAIVQQLVDY
jgi:2-oxoisovalerate dehydrogenase E1 component